MFIRSDGTRGTEGFHDPSFISPSPSQMSQVLRNAHLSLLHYRITLHRFEHEPHGCLSDAWVHDKQPSASLEKHNAHLGRALEAFHYFVYFPLGFTNESSFNGSLLAQDYGLLVRGEASLVRLFPARLHSRIEFYKAPIPPYEYSITLRRFDHKLRSCVSLPAFRDSESISAWNAAIVPPIGTPFESGMKTAIGSL
uniref:Uncharacterized protein n=1 Tax=Candidatus Kentrum sp. LFY TaxID=2126342 RepID=A0A450V688_9GAMM|nr:MAG: hypothetical protein BECKLFY1418B_GA0070995_11812 [Candidatus Kentron sp. LFY]